MPERPSDSFDQRLVDAALAALPPVRDDEPPSLRQDILDELRDHLACAFRSELLRTNGDAARAEYNVRKRFGDPARIARRLWFDAMKGNLMTQKILIGTCVVLVLVSLGFYALMWQAFTSSQERSARLAEQTQAANATLLAEARKTNAALLARVEDLASNSASDPQWNQVTLRLKPNFPAPISHAIKTIRVAEHKQGGESREFKPDLNNVVDCGLMQPGKYTVSLETTWGEVCYRQITVLPGRSLEVTITCPAAIPRTVPVEWKIDWPQNLGSYEDRDATWLLVLINGELRRTFDDSEWRIAGGKRLLAFHPDGRMLNLATADPRSNQTIISSGSFALENFLRDRDNTTWQVKPDRLWAEGHYVVHEMGYARLDQAEGPLSLLFDPDSPSIHLGGGVRTGFLHGTLGSELDTPLPPPELVPPTIGAAVGTIDVPPGLVKWAKLRRTENPSYRNRQISVLELYPLFRERADRPVEARRPASAR